MSLFWEKHTCACACAQMCSCSYVHCIMQIFDCSARWKCTKAICNFGISRRKQFTHMEKQTICINMNLWLVIRTNWKCAWLFVTECIREQWELIHFDVLLQTIIWCICSSHRHKCVYRAGEASSAARTKHILLIIILCASQISCVRFRVNRNLYSRGPFYRARCCWISVLWSIAASW